MRETAKQTGRKKQFELRKILFLFIPLAMVFAIMGYLGIAPVSASVVILLLYFFGILWFIAPDPYLT